MALAYFFLEDLPMSKCNDQKKQDLYHVNRQTDLQWLEADDIIAERQAKGPASDAVWNPATRRMELVYDNKP